VGSTGPSFFEVGAFDDVIPVVKPFVDDSFMSGAVFAGIPLSIPAGQNSGAFLESYSQ
jgi:hypothetical protein